MIAEAAAAVASVPGEGEGVAAQALVRLGADLNRVRQQVIQLLHGYQGKEPAPPGAAPRRARSRAQMT